MTITQDLKNEIVKEVMLLESVDDGVGIEIGNGKGLFIQVVDYGEGKEYLIELNNVDEDNVYEPCKEYNTFSEFGNAQKLIENIEEYLS